MKKGGAAERTTAISARRVASLEFVDSQSCLTWRAGGRLSGGLPAPYNQGRAGDS